MSEMFGPKVPYLEEIIVRMGERLECMEDRDEGTCRGPVDWHSVDPGRANAFPRCELHWEQRLDRRETTSEKYERSDLAPSWLDSTWAGEEW